MKYRIPSLDGFRAIAILMVLAGHVSVTEHFPDDLRHAKWLTRGGLTGVQVFFVVSGFLITTLLFADETASGRVSLKHFYVRRCLRILPVYGCYVFAAFAFDRWHRVGVVKPGDFAQACTFTTGLFRGRSWVLGHTWSLAVEEHFYLAWPIAFAFTSTRIRFVIAAVVVVTWPLLRVGLSFLGWPWLIEFSFLGQGDCIMWGCLTALCVRRFPTIIERIASTTTGVGRLLVVAIIVIVAVLEWNGFLEELVLPFGNTLTAVGVCYLVCSYTLCGKGISYRFLNCWPIVTIGTLSYSIYLWQEIILFPRNPNQLWWQMFPQNLAFVFLVATISYLIIEKPFLRLRKTWSARES